MRLIQSDWIRAICMIAIGAVVVKYRTDALLGITIATGALFVLTGLAACCGYCLQKRRWSKQIAAPDAAPAVSAPSSATLIAGAGCVGFGLVLACIPSTFLSIIEQILALLLIAGAIKQMADLVSVGRKAHVHWAYWIMPIVILIVGIMVIAKPLQLLSAPLFVCGWCMMLYGVVELIYALKIYLLRRQLNREAEAEATAFEEVTEETETGV